MSLEMNPGTVVGAGLGGLAVGGGLRLTKHLMDIFRDRDEEPIAKVPTAVPAVTGMPVDVTPEEAAELERQGVKVLRKKADFLDSVGLGALAVGGAYGGWKGIDSYLESGRQQAVQAKLDKAKKRIQNLLEDNPDAQDIPMHAAMKAAEDHFFEKKALGIIDGLGLGVGGIGAIGLASAFNRAKAMNKHEANAKKLRKALMEGSQEQPAYATIVPVLNEAAPGKV